MKKPVHPAVAGILIIVAIVLVAFIFRAATGGGGDVPPMGVGKPGPFSPGGAATKSYKPPAKPR